MTGEPSPSPRPSRCRSTRSPSTGTTSCWWVHVSHVFGMRARGRGQRQADPLRRRPDRSKRRGPRGHGAERLGQDHARPRAHGQARLRGARRLGDARRRRVAQGLPRGGEGAGRLVPRHAVPDQGGPGVSLGRLRCGATTSARAGRSTTGLRDALAARLRRAARASASITASSIDRSTSTSPAGEEAQRDAAARCSRPPRRSSTKSTRAEWNALRAVDRHVEAATEEERAGVLASCALQPPSHRAQHRRCASCCAQRRAAAGPSWPGARADRLAGYVEAEPELVAGDPLADPFADPARLRWPTATSLDHLRYRSQEVRSRRPSATSRSTP